MSKKLRITFVLPFVNITGGIKILFEHANRLAERGHTVCLVYPGKLFHGDNFEITNSSWQWRWIKAPFRQLKYWFFVSLLHKTEADWFPIDRRVVLQRTPDLSARYIPTADIVIATANETVDWVATYPAEKGVKLYLAQDYEVWARPAKYVDKTFSHTDMHLITIGSWQKKLFEEKFGRVVEAIIHDGVDTQRFRPAASDAHKEHKSTRVLLSYHHLEYKGIPDGLYAIEEAKKAGYSIQTVMFGVHNLKSNVPGDIEYHQNLQEDELPYLYRSCDIFLWPTHREGFGLPPMEAMACGVPVVGTDAGAMPDYMKDGVTGYMVAIKQPKLLAEKLIRLLAEPELRQKMGRAAAAEMKKWDWDKQTEKLEQYLLGITRETT
jgi:L-malate glycosyltransferase